MIVQNWMLFTQVDKFQVSVLMLIIEVLCQSFKILVTLEITLVAIEAISTSILMKFHLGCM